MDCSGDLKACRSSSSGLLRPRVIGTEGVHGRVHIDFFLPTFFIRVTAIVHFGLKRELSTGHCEVHRLSAGAMDEIYNVTLFDKEKILTLFQQENEAAF